MSKDNLKKILWVSLFFIIMVIVIQVEEKNYNHKLQKDLENFSRDINYEPEWIKWTNPSIDSLKVKKLSEENSKFSENETFENDTFNFDSELDGFTPEDYDIDPDDPEYEEWYDFNGE